MRAWLRRHFIIGAREQEEEAQVGDIHITFRGSTLCDQDARKIPDCNKVHVVVFEKAKEWYERDFCEECVRVRGSQVRHDRAGRCRSRCRCCGCR